MKATDKQPLEEAHWRPLANAFRAELQECGWLLSLLESLQKDILRRDSHSVYELNNAVVSQMDIVDEAQEKRETLAEQTVGDTSFAELTRRLPDAAQPLFDAFVEEAETLQRKIQRKARQNQALLARAAHDAKTLAAMLMPSIRPVAYNRRGENVKRAPGAGASIAALG